jgi:hypothetical protein
MTWEGALLIPARPSGLTSRLNGVIGPDDQGVNYSIQYSSVETSSVAVETLFGELNGASAYSIYGQFTMFLWGSKLLERCTHRMSGEHEPYSLGYPGVQNSTQLFF